MNVTPRLMMIKQYEPKINRTEFKVIFALTMVDGFLSEGELAKRTGLGNGRIKDIVKSLLFHNMIVETKDKYAYNDDMSAWKTDLLNSRNFYAKTEFKYSNTKENK